MNFTVIKADKINFDVRTQMSGDFFRRVSSNGIEYFSKDKDTIIKAFAHMFVLDQFSCDSKAE